jgi:hypothetical protein
MLHAPAGLISTLALLSAWPALLVLAPTGISSSRVLPQEWSYELAFLGQAVGTVLGLAALERVAPLLTWDRTGARLAGDCLAIAVCGTAGALIALLPRLAFPGSPVTSTAGSLTREFLLSLAAIATAAAALVRLRLVPGLAPWLLALGILFAPMLLPLPVPNRSLVLLALGFALAAWLLDHSPTMPVRAR